MDFGQEACYNRPCKQTFAKGQIKDEQKERDNKMASIRRVTHKSGRVVYRIVISHGYDSQGRKKVKSLTYSVNQSATPKAQRKEAMRYALEMEDQIKYGRSNDVPPPLFEDFAEKWLEHVKGSLAYGTYVGYEHLLHSRICPYFKEYRLDQVKVMDIEAFYKTLEQEYSAGTIRRFANVLSCIFGTARRWNLIAGNPCRYARKPRKVQEQAGLRYFTPHQSMVFLKSLQIPCPVSSQYRLFYTLSLLCGFRKGETLALCWEDIDFERREISITKSIGRTETGFHCKEPKNHASVRRVPLPDILYDMLEKYQEEYDLLARNLGREWQGDGSLFIRSDGRRMGHTTTYQHFVRHLSHYNQWVKENPDIALSQDMEKLPVIPLHGLRHSCATLLNYLEVNMVDISRYLGHARCSTTMNLYAHSFEEQKRRASEKLNHFVKSQEQWQTYHMERKI